MPKKAEARRRERPSRGPPSTVQPAETAAAEIPAVEKIHSELQPQGTDWTLSMVDME